MQRRSVEIPVLRDPHGNPVRASISWTLTDLSGKRIVGVDSDGDPVADYRQILTGDEPTSIEITPTDRISPPSQYQLDIATPAGRTRHVVQIESGETELTFAEMLALPAGVASGEILGNRLLPDPTELPNDYLAVVRNGAWIGTTEFPSINGTDGREIEVAANTTHIIWRYEDEVTWRNLISLDAIKGEDGTSVRILGALDNSSELPPAATLGDAYLIDGELWVWNGAGWESVGNIQGPPGTPMEVARVGDNIVWRYVGNDTWTLLIEIDELTGPAPQMRFSDAEIQWKLTSEVEWSTLFPISEITPSDIGAEPAGAAADAVSAHAIAIDHGPIATAVQPAALQAVADSIPTTPAAVGAEPVGAVAAHESSFDHTLIGTALQSSQATADGLELLGATREEQKTLLNIGDSLLFGDRFGETDNQILMGDRYA